MRFLKLAYLIIGSTLASCCDICHEDIYPCITVKLGEIKNSEYIMSLGFFDLHKQTFKSSYGNVAIIDTNDISFMKELQPSKPCDSTFYYQKQWVFYDAISFGSREFAYYFCAEFIKSEIQDSLIESLKIAVNEFSANLKVTEDTLFVLSKNITIDHVDSISLGKYVIRNAYHLKRDNFKVSEINGVYFTLENGLIAFYSKNNDFWVRQ